MGEKGTYRIEGRPYDARRAFNELSKPAHGFRPSWSTEGSFFVQATPEEAQEIINLLRGFASLRMRDVGAGARKYEAWARARLEEKQGNGSQDPRQPEIVRPREIVSVTAFPVGKRGGRKSVPRPPDEEFRSSLRERGVEGTATHYGVSKWTVRYLWTPGIEGAKELIPDGRSGRRVRRKILLNNVHL